MGTWAARSRLYNPVLFQGERLLGRGAAYFEGWYYKLAFPDSPPWALIPGVSLAAPDAHAFIQVVDGEGGRCSYRRFPLGDFAFARRPFQIRFGENLFSLQQIEVRLEGFQASLRIREPVRWPSTLLSPSSMGWYAFMRFMECYHGIILLDARLEGRVNGRELSSGRLYVEKDWGTGFPRAWVWMQSNSFGDRDEGVSLTCSVARVPFRGREFTGFIIGLLVEGTLQAFTTYNGSRLERVAFDRQTVQVQVRRGDLCLRLRARRQPGVSLASPVAGAMQGRIDEALGALIEVELERAGRVLYSGRGADAGLEVVAPEALLRGVEARPRAG